MPLLLTQHLEQSKMKKHIFPFLLSFWVSIAAKAQFKITGKILDPKHQAIGNAIVRAGTVAASTDRDGKFELVLQNKHGHIDISHINYRPKNVLYTFPDSLIVTLERNEFALEEVVVYSDGYQSLPKERATGSFEMIANKILNQRSSLNIIDKLESTVPGLQFDRRKSATVMNVRGLGSFSDALLKPLIILDNFPYEGELSNINPNDIESVTVLKDAAASSIWGARAGNGVIVLKSKRNAERSKGKWDAGVSFMITKKADLDYLQLMSSADFIAVEQQLYEKGFYKSALSNSSASYLFSPVVKLLRDIDVGKISKPEADRQLERYRNINYKDDMQHYFFRNAVLQQYNASYATHSDLLTSRFSVGYDRNLANAVTDKNNRFTLKSDLIYQLGKNLELSTAFQYVNTTANQAPSAFSFPINPGGNRQALYPYAQLVDENQNAAAIAYAYDPDYLIGISDPLLDWTMKPYKDIFDSRTDDKMDYFNGGLNLIYSFSKNFKFTGQYNIEKQIQQQQTLFTEDAYFTRNLINQFTTSTNGLLTYGIPKGAINTLSDNRMLSHRGRAQLNYEVNNNLHLLTVLAGAEYSKRTSESSSSRVYGYDVNLKTSQPVDYVTLFQTYRGLAGKQSIPYLMSDQMRENRFVSFFANVGYTFFNKYTVSASARRDASNMFGVKTNDRWNPLWSVGTAWYLSKEKWMQQIPEINHLKLRWTIGHSGNIGGITGSEPIITYTKAPSGAQTTLPRALISALPNPSLKWEDIRMINYGLDFGLFNNKISGSIEYFNKLSSDLLATDLIDPTSGFSSMTKNVGKLLNRGFDFKLSGRIGHGRFSWIPTLFLSSSKNKVLEFYGNLSTGTTYTTNTGTSMRPLKDKSLYPVFSYVFAGLDPLNGDPQGIYKGQVSKDYRNMLRDSIQNLSYHGTALPPYYGAFRNEFNWKNMSVSFNISYKFGHYFQKETIRYASLYNSWISHKDYEKRWVKPGDELTTTVPSMNYPADTNRDTFYANSEANIEKGDIVKLQDVQFSYAPDCSRFFSSKKLNVRLFFNANNVCVLWRATKSGLDADFLGIPNARNFTIGLNVSY